MSSPTDELTKQFLKSMPIMGPIEEFKTKLKLLQNDIALNLEDLESLEERVLKLPTLNTSNEIRISGCSTDTELNIERVFRKVDGRYEPYEEQARRVRKQGDENLSRSDQMLREHVRINQEVYAMEHPNKPWVKCQVVLIKGKAVNYSKKINVTFRLQTIEGENQRFLRDVDKYSIALIQNHGDELRTCKRVIAGLTPSMMMPGIIAQRPSDISKQRYLVFMDDSSANYFKPEQIYPILGQSAIPWKDARRLRGPDYDLSLVTEFEAHLNTYFRSYPMRRIMEAEIGDEIQVRKEGLVKTAKLLDIDCDTYRIWYPEDNSEETVYRGSARLSNKEHEKALLLRGQACLSHFIKPELLMIIYSYHKASEIALNTEFYKPLLKSKLQIAVKSTATAHKSQKRVKVDLCGELVEEDLKNVDTWDEEKFKELNHKCSPNCLNIKNVKTETSVKDIVAEFRNVSDLKVPLLLGWKRRLYRFPMTAKNPTQMIGVVYEAPCGRLFKKDVYQIKNYLKQTGSILDIDYFSAERSITLNTHDGEHEAIYYVPNIAVDSRMKPLENKNISAFNSYNMERIPYDFKYSPLVQPHDMLKKNGWSPNEDFKSGCDCEDNCYSRSTCSCHILNEEFAGSNAYTKGSINKSYQYNTHKRLDNQVMTGLFECNSFCKCSSKCNNRVVQNGIRFRLQVRKTPSKGWGVITLDDIPKGSFVCTYAAELLDDADQYGDSDIFFADLDYITVNENNKEGFPDSSDDEGVVSDVEEMGYYPVQRAPSLHEVQPSESQSSNPRYPKRKVREQREMRQRELELAAGRFNRSGAQFKKIKEILKHYQEYTLDARVIGNVGRFLNHSCDPNTFVQNVFIESHDLRFPNVAFFAIRTIKALTEITWNYSYKTGAIAGRRIDCHCGASNCSGRIL